MDLHIEILDVPLRGYFSKLALRTEIVRARFLLSIAPFCSHAEALQRLLRALALHLLEDQDRQAGSARLRGQVPLLRRCQDEQSL